MNRLWFRLSLGFLLVAWASVGALAFVVRQTTETGFRRYINQQNASEISQTQLSRLQLYYEENGSWTGAESVLGARGEGAGRGGAERAGASFNIADLDGHIVASTDQALIGTTIPAASVSQTVQIMLNGQPVGLFYRRTPGEDMLGSAEIAFLNEANRSLALTGLIVSVLAVAAGIGLSRLLVRPLKGLTLAIEALPMGKLGQQVDVEGTVEVTALAQAFNRMSAQLADSETLRQRMAADIAHELRTPVSVLRGHLEAMRDGVFALDQVHLAVAHDQTLYLGRLVDDLRLLTLAEARHLPLNIGSVAFTEIARDLVERFMPLALDADVQLNFDTSAPNTHIQADRQRLEQVLGNLLTNALRHTPAGGKISVKVWQEGDKLRLAVKNTGSHLSEHEAQQVFLPFWRTSESRDHDVGGSGLGLAISRQLIELHQGRIWVESSPGQVRFVLELPCES